MLLLSCPHLQVGYFHLSDVFDISHLFERPMKYFRTFRVIYHVGDWLLDIHDI